MGHPASQHVAFNGEVTLALVAGVALEGLTRDEATLLRAQAAERGLVTLGVHDLSARFGRPTRAVVGLSVQLAFARSGPEEVDREDLNEAIVQMAQRDLDWLREHGQVGTPSLHMVASGPMASGVAALGRLHPSGELAAAGDGTFIVGSDMDRRQHSRGVWGRSLAFASWESSAIATLAPERQELLFDETRSFYLVPSYDV
ncbi:MAG: hypothetical protein ACI9KE_004141 [Polyangiales bacterium]|jgi:hypothetical protein